MSKSVANRSHAKKIKATINTQLLNGKFRLCSANSRTRTMLSLNELRQTGELCDAKLKVGGRLIHVHRCVLAVQSDYFRAMFSVDMQENHSGIISLESITNEEVLNKLIDYLYTGVLEVSIEEIQDLLVISDMLQMTEVKEACAQQMFESMCAANCIGMLTLSRQFLMDDIGQSAIAMIKAQFPSVCSLDEFLELEIQDLCEIVSYEDLLLGPRKEDDVVYAVLRWVKHKFESRKTKFHQVVPIIRWKCVSKVCMDHLKSHQSLENCPEFWKEFERCQDDVCQARCPPRYICILGGYMQSRTGPTCPQLVDVYRMNPTCENPKWLEMTATEYTAPYAMAFNFNGKLLCIMIRFESGYLDVIEYSIFRNTWENISHTMACDQSDTLMHCVMAKGVLFYDEATRIIHGLSSERHFSISVKDSEGDAVFDEVLYLPDNKTFSQNIRGNHCLVTVDSNLYAIGGTDFRSLTEAEQTADVYAYNFESKVWETRASMNDRRSSGAAVAFNGYIYVIGGFADVRLKTMERYYPASNQWTVLSSMAKPRTHFPAVCINNNIIVMGGKSYASLNGGARKVLSTCEKYDPDTDQWSPLPEMPQRRCMFPATVI